MFSQETARELPTEKPRAGFSDCQTKAVVNIFQLLSMFQTGELIGGTIGTSELIGGTIGTFVFRLRCKELKRTARNYSSNHTGTLHSIIRHTVLRVEMTARGSFFDRCKSTDGRYNQRKMSMCRYPEVATTQCVALDTCAR